MTTYAIVGAAGIIAPTHCAAILQTGGTLVGLLDLPSRKAELEARAAQFACPAYTDLQTMLAEAKPDVVSVCVPHPLHPAIAIACLEAGCHVLCEKPLAVDMLAANSMIAAAERTGKVLAVSFQHRLRPAVAYMKQFISEGLLGALVRVLVTEPWLRTHAYYRSAAWRGKWATEGGGVLMNQAPHTLDLLCYLVGLPKSVWGIAQRRYQPIECEDTVQAMLTYHNGAPGYFATSTAEAGGERRIEIVGEAASLTLVGDLLTVQKFNPPMRQFISEDPRLFSGPEITNQQLHLPTSGGEGNHVAVYSDLEQALVARRPPVCDARSAAMSLALANAIIFSSALGQAVTLPLDAEAYAALLARYIADPESALAP
jgi:UDP-N-acetyl-2-amino-2-deoxyglucuronate dehydrogenase